jgi:site-specific DNA recombinase
MTRVRCAIYTRKSSDEGLEQDFNSLDAQHAACAAYIVSQTSAGWVASSTRYDDGGVSGGTLERPALKRLLADIASGLVDIVVVYKIDRLTRSLLDFAKLVEAFDASDTSFVSITQSFNTTSSMGRLTLNMLLSFAQFEREVTAERIRDKIAASKARGMWMGGTPPLGYAPHGRTLTIVPDHAALIRDIYARYLQLGSVRSLQEQLHSKGIYVPQRISGTGKAYGGGMFSRGHLYAILGNPIYTGMIAHRGTVYPGLHPAIIDAELWDQVQQMRQGHVRGDHVRMGRRTYRPADASILVGKLFDDQGAPLIATHACKGPKRYRYYVSKNLHHKTAVLQEPRDEEGQEQAHGLGQAPAQIGAHAGEDQQGWRIPAREIEGVVIQELQMLFADPIAMLRQMGCDLPLPNQMPNMLKHAKTIAVQLSAASSANIHQSVAQAIGKVILQDAHITLHLDCIGIASLLQLDAGEIAKPEHVIDIPVTLTRNGIAMKLVHRNGTAPVAGTTANTLIKTIARGHALWQHMQRDSINITELAQREGVTTSYASRIMMLAFLDPWIIEQIVAGKHPASLDARKLTLSGMLPVRWKDQREMFGFENTEH